MALVLGTNCGFVTTAPTSDPAGGGQFFADNYCWTIKDTSPVGAAKITEIGWWCDGASEAANFEVGIYSHNVGDDEPENRLFVDDTNAKGTTAGWKTVAVDWVIDAETIYWIAFQLDDTATTSFVDYTNTPAAKVSHISGVSTLPNPWGSGHENVVVLAVYAVWEEAASGTNMKINIGDTLKDVSEMKINIGDVLKNVVEVKQNIGDVLKTVF